MEKYKNVQLVNRETGLCLGDINSNSNQKPGLVQCNPNDQSQRWDVSNIVDDFGILEKTNLSNGKRVTLSRKNGIAEFDYQMYSPDTQISDPTVLTLDRDGNIRTIFFDDPDQIDPFYQVCLNVSNGIASSDLSSSRPYEMTDYYSLNNCNNKWDIMFDCMSYGTKNPNGVICDRRTGDFVCKPGFFGKNCDFEDSSAKNQQAAYDNMWQNCQNGITTTMSTPQNCVNYHKTQPWIMSMDKTKWYNNNFNMWNLVQTDDINYNGKLIENKSKLADIDATNDSLYVAYKKTYDDSVDAINTAKNNLTNQQVYRIADKTTVYNSTNDKLNKIKNDILTYSIPANQPEVVAAKKDNSIKIAIASNTKTNLQIKNDDLAKKLAAAKQKDQDILKQIDALKAGLNK